MAGRRTTRLRPPVPRAAPAESGRSKAVRVVTAVAANVTLFTALLYYFGFLYTQVFFEYFRLHYTVLGQTADEILARGVDGLLLPVAGTAGAGLVVLGAVRYLRHRLTDAAWAALLRGCAPVAAAGGLALVGVTVSIALDPRPYRAYAGLPGLGFAAGVVLLVFAWHRWSPGFAVAEWVVTYLLVTFGLFWSVGDYSGAVGTRRAFETAAGIPARPAVTLYSAESLNLGIAAETRCAAPEAAYKYRYTGLKLLLQSGGQYVFVPADWRPATGVTAVLPRTDKLRLEFGPPTGRAVEPC
ncbi:hypothetical protein OHS18_09710 [Amycolatopsis sp. NBC_00355]|uniref:hypothetical protein n=1 Tax=Amycolatopsis sp. NBC_00355 TaxID=2975957 RepID=UPI002E26B685